MPEKTPKIQLLEALKLFHDETDKEYLKRAPEYTVEKLEVPTEGFSESYELKKDGEAVGDTINIPIFSFINTAEVKVVEVDDEPIEGYKAGDTYLDFELNDAEGKLAHLYIGTQEIVETALDTTPVYNFLEVENTSPDTYKKYSLIKDNETIGDVIDIPNNKSLSNLSVKTVTAKNNPISGYQVGEQYLDFAVDDANNTTSHLYLNIKEISDSISKLAPVYGLSEIANNSSSIYKKYRLTKDALATGDTISIPNYKSLDSLAIRTVSAKNSPVAGYKVGEQYFDFTTVDANNNITHLYLNIKEFSSAISNLAPEYSVSEKSEAEDGFEKSYTLTRNGFDVGTVINIPYSTLVKSASIGVAEVANEPIEGLAIGESYIDFVTTAADGTDSHIYLSVREAIPAIVIGGARGTGNVITNLDYINGRLTPYKNITALQATDLNIQIEGQGDFFTNASYDPANKRFLFTKNLGVYTEITFEEISELWVGGT